MGPCSRMDSSWDLWGQWLCPPVGQGSGSAGQPCQCFKSWGLSPVGLPTGVPGYSSPCDQDGGGAGCVWWLIGITAQSQVSTQCQGREAGLGPHMGEAVWGSRQGCLVLPRKNIHSQAVPGWQFMGPLANSWSVFLR